MHITAIRRLAPLGAFAVLVVPVVLVVLVVLEGGVIGAASTAPAAQSRRALSSADIDDIATLLKLEDTRQYDEAELSRILQSSHPEVLRRAVVAIGLQSRPFSETATDLSSLATEPC